MKSKVSSLVLFLLVFIAEAQEKKRNVYNDVISAPLNYYKKYYSNCDDKENVKLSIYEDEKKEVISTIHKDYLITIIPIRYDENNLSINDIIKRQYDSFISISKNFKSDLVKDLKSSYTNICNRNTLVLDYWENERVITFNENNLTNKRLTKVYYKTLYLFDKGIFKGEDILYKVIMNNSTKSGLKNDFNKFKNCFSINNKHLLNIPKPLDEHYTEIFLNELNNKLDRIITKEIERQGTIFINEKSYKSTRTFSFKMNSIPFGPSGTGIYNDKKLKITVAKKGNKGLLYLEYDDSDNYVYDSTTLFKGNILIRLGNGKTIRCIDRNIKGYSDKQSTAVYHLSVKEIEQLKLYNISSINFTLVRSDYLDDVKRNLNAENQNDITHFSVKALFR